MVFCKSCFHLTFAGESFRIGGIDLSFGPKLSLALKSQALLLLWGFVDKSAAAAELFEELGFEPETPETGVLVIVTLTDLRSDTEEDEEQDTALVFAEVVLVSRTCPALVTF